MLVMVIFPMTFVTVPIALMVVVPIRVAGLTIADKSERHPESSWVCRGLPSPASTTYRKILTVVFVAVTIVVAVFPVTIVTVMLMVFVPFSFFAAIPLTTVPLITVMLVSFAIVSARYGNGELLR